MYSYTENLEKILPRKLSGIRTFREERSIGHYIVTRTVGEDAYAIYPNDRIIWIVNRLDLRTEISFLVKDHGEPQAIRFRRISAEFGPFGPDEDNFDITEDVKWNEVKKYLQ